MGKFTSTERLVVIIILCTIGVISFFNFKTSLRRSRDAQRRSDVNSIYNGLEAFYIDNGVFPFASEDGEIKACEHETYDEDYAKLEEEELTTQEFMMLLRPCEWGQEPLTDVMNGSDTVYMQNVPLDPRTGEGYSYRYISNGNRFQLFVYLEGGADEEGYKEEVVARNLSCGINLCSFGRGFEKTPLDKTLEEYENELAREKQKAK